MKLTILGCSGPYPAANGATSGYLVEEKDTVILADCGSGVLSRLMGRVDPCQLQAVCLSHLHYDHMCDMLPMQYYLQNKEIRLPVYVPGEDRSPVRALLDVPAYDLREYEHTTRIGAITLSHAPSRHPVPCHALKFSARGKTLVYTGDAAEGESLVDFCSGADVLLADAAFLERQWHEKAPHMSARRAAQLAREAGVRLLLLTHLPPSNVPALLLEEAKEVFANTHLARCGDRYEI